MSDIDTIREALQWIISKSRSLGEYHSTLDPETAHGLIVEIPHECNEALAALDRIQAQRQSNAEPVAKAIAMVDDFRWAHEHAMELATATHGPMPEGYDDDDEPDTPWHCFTSAHRAHRAHPPASTEPPSYVYSRDYEALYDLLMRGGEALGLKDMPGKRHPVILTQKTCGMPDGYPLATFVRMCQGMNLEWIAPSTEPRLTVEQAMDACAAANVEWSNGGYKGTKKREWADEYKRMLRDRLTKAAKP